MVKWICVHGEIYSDDIHRVLNETNSSGAPVELIQFDLDYPFARHSKCFHTHDWNWHQSANGLDGFGYRWQHCWMHEPNAFGLAASQAFCAVSMARRMDNVHFLVLCTRRIYDQPMDNGWAMQNVNIWFAQRFFMRTMDGPSSCAFHIITAGAHFGRIACVTCLGALWFRPFLRRYIIML